MRRGAVVQGAQQESEALLGLLVGEPDRAEDALLELGAVDTDGARRDLAAVDDHVVGLRQDGAGIRLNAVLILGAGRREHVVLGDPALLVLVVAKQREVDDKQHRPSIGVGQFEALGEVRTQRAKHPHHDGLGVGREEDRVARVGAGRRADAVELVLRQELGDRRTHLTRLVEQQVRESLAAPLLGELGELVEVLAAEARAPGAGQRTHAATALDGTLEDAEARVAHELGDVADLEAVAKVGLVAAEAQDRLAVRHLREGPRQIDVEDLLPDAAVQVLGEIEDLVALDERHLEVELRELELAIRALRLIAEATSDLVVAFEPGHHVELLEQLWRLRQGIDAAGVQACRDHEVARALRCRLRQDRRLELEEALCLEVVADDARHLRADLEVLLHLVAAQIQRAMADAQRLVDVLVVELERQRIARCQLVKFVDEDLNGAGREIRVDGSLGTRHDLAAGVDDALDTNRLGHLDRLRGVLGVDHELDNAAAIAQIDEDQTAMVAQARGPTGGVHLVAELGGVKFAAVPGPVRHVLPLRLHEMVDQIVERNFHLLAAGHIAHEADPARPLIVAADDGSCGTDAIGLLHLALDGAASEIGLADDTGVARAIKQRVQFGACVGVEDCEKGVDLVRRHW